MSQKEKMAVAEKAKIIRSYLAGTISPAEAARRGGVAPSTLDDWTRIYRNEGVIGLATGGKNRVYSPELKKRQSETVTQNLAFRLNATVSCSTCPAAPATSGPPGSVAPKPLRTKNLPKKLRKSAQ